MTTKISGAAITSPSITTPTLDGDKVITNPIQINDSLTATNNFVLKADNLGGLKLSRGNDGATSSDILTIDASDQVALSANTTNKLVSASGSAPVYGCRAWCTFNGNTAGTNAPIAGGNVTSVTRNAVGDYTINFTVALPDNNYMFSGSAIYDSAGGTPTNYTALSFKQGAQGTFCTTTTCRVYAIYTASAVGGPTDMELIRIAFFR